MPETTRINGAVPEHLQVANRNRQTTPKRRSSQLVLCTTLAWRRIDDEPAHQQDGLHRILPYLTAEENVIHSRSWDHCQPRVSLHSEQTGILQCGLGPSTGLHHCTTTACSEWSSQTYQRSTSTRSRDTSTARPALAALAAYSASYQYKLCVLMHMVHTGSSPSYLSVS